MLRGSTIVLALMLVGEGLGLVMIMVVGNFYSVADAGLLLTLQNNLFLFGTIGALGLGTCFHRFVPNYLENCDFPVIRGVQRWVLGIALIGLSLAALVHTVFLLTSPETAALTTDVAVMAGAAVIFWGVVTLNRQLMRAMRLTFWSEFSYQVVRPLGGTLILLLGVLWGGSPLLVTLALLVPLVLGTGHDLWRTGRLIEGHTGPASYAPRGDWVESARSFTLFHMARVVLQRLDLLTVAALLGLEAAAIYGLAARLARLVVLAVDPIMAMFQPRASLHHEQNDIAALRRDVIQGSLWIGVTALTVTGLFLASAPFWLTLFGDISEGNTSLILLFVLLVGYFTQANCSMAASILLMTGNERIVARLAIVLSLVVYPVFLWLGIEIWGVAGAAGATTLIRIINSAALLWLTRRRMGFWAIAQPTPTNLAIAFGPIWAKMRQPKT